MNYELNKRELTVYKASAGSGKTFTLATQYIRLLIANPTSYKNILAVTFTNKATEEMKKRILSQLYGIWKALPSSEQYFQAVSASLPDYGEAMVRERAGVSLLYLLHNYNYFQVETIDTFFQSVLRNLARELDLTPNLRIGLNDKQVEEEAVDEMIGELGENHETLRRVMQYVYDNISEDKNWNVVSRIKEFGEIIFKDFYRSHSDAFLKKIEEEGFFESFIKRLREARTDAKQKMKDMGEEFLNKLKEKNLTIDDISNKERGVCGFFIKLTQGVFKPEIVGSRVMACLEDAEKWVAQKHVGREYVLLVVKYDLQPILAKALAARAECWKNYQSATVTLAHLNQLRLLGAIEKKIREINDAHERFLLSDTQHLLQAVIQDNDSPFVFEKTGSRLEHVMIDEFQDTGSIQWSNFKILLKECMSHEGSNNLIVGDVKQSIYRWRSGDWRILNGIENEFAHADRCMDIRTLNTNYRSGRNIIAFNNAFFTYALEIEKKNQQEVSEDAAAQLQHAYEDVCQQTPETNERGGNVKITLLPDIEGYKEHTMQVLAHSVAELLADGVDESEMAILVRVNRDIPLIANYFASKMPGVRIVSDDAFRLDASPAVNIMICAMRVIAHPNDYLQRVTLAALYQRDVMGDTTTIERQLMAKDVDVDTLLPDGWRALMARHSHMSLYEMAEAIYRLFTLDEIEAQTDYVCAFYDQLAKYTDDGIPSLRGFLEEWERSIREKTIQETSVDGIRIVSIHKSKGLEFNHVFVPFCDWALEKKNEDVLWGFPTEAPYNELPFIPVDYSRALMGTVFENDYLQEFLQKGVDNLNLLYVAFTRACDGLYVMGKLNVVNSRSHLIEQCLSYVAGLLPNATLENETMIMDDDEAIVAQTFTLTGESAKKKDKREKKRQETSTATERQTDGISSTATERTTDGDNDNVFDYVAKPERVEIKHYTATPSFKQSNASIAFVDGEDEEASNNYITIGCVLHKLFSTIRTTDDVNDTLMQMTMDGVIADEKMAGEIREMMYRRLTDARVAEWFSPRWRLFNECAVLSYDKATDMVITRRPDRVMTDGDKAVVVDFKFGKPHPEHHEQVREYVDLLMRMGYASVEGYIWYVYRNKIETV